MRKIKVVVLLVQQLHHAFTKNAKVSPNLTVARYIVCCLSHTKRPECSFLQESTKIGTDDLW